MAPSIVILLLLGGVFAGFVNTLAGGGSLLTLPILIFAGLDASVANGTNRIAILAQSVVAVWGFRRHGAFPAGRAQSWIVTALVGAALGALAVVEVPEPALRLIVVLVLLLAVPAVARPPRPKGYREGERSGPRVLGGVTVTALLFFCSFYGGFLQAGVGFLLLAVLVPIAGLDLVRANAVKVLLVGVYTLVALPIFVLERQVDLRAGLVLAIGNLVGAHLATRFAVRAGAGAVRWVVVAALVIAALALGVEQLRG